MANEAFELGNGDEEVVIVAILEGLDVVAAAERRPVDEQLERQVPHHR